MNYDVNVINIVLLRQNYENLKLKYESFKNISFDKFLNSYLNKTSETFVNNIAIKLENQYKLIDRKYNKILNWFEEYLENIEGIESKLVGNDSFISDSLVRNYIDANLKEQI